MEALEKLGKFLVIVTKPLKQTLVIVFAELGNFHDESSFRPLSSHFK